MKNITNWQRTQHWRWHTAIAAFVCLMCGLAAGVRAEPDPAIELLWEQVRPGLRYAQQDIAADGTKAVHRLHWLALDLAQPDLYLALTPQDCAGARMSQWDLPTTVASVNASFFTRDFFTRGHTVSRGKTWIGSMNHQDSPVVACTTGRQCQVLHEPPAHTAPEWREVAAGVYSLVRDGIGRTMKDDARCGSFCTAAHPRSAMGLDRERRTVMWVAAEGRQKSAVGMSLASLAGLMADQGIADAINLDGGGSTAMHINGQLRTGRPDNEPAQRRIANAWVISTQANVAWSAACPTQQPILRANGQTGE